MAQYPLIPVIERKTLCLSSPAPGIASHYGESGFADTIANSFATPENNAAEKLVELKAELKKADTETFWRRLMEGMTDICHAQYGFVAKRILVDDHDSAIEMPPIGEPGSCLLGVAFYYNDGQDPPITDLHRDYRYLAWGAPCAHMRHDKVFLIPNNLSSFITNNPNAFPFPTEAYLGVPLFADGKCFAHFGMMWTEYGLKKKDVSWGYMELILHGLEDLILERLLGGESFAKAPSKTSATKPVKVIPQEAITASQSLKPYAKSLSHELRTPMQGVVGMLDVMHANVQEAIEGQHNSRVRNVFQALKDNIEVVQDSSRRAIEAADNVVHAYDLNMQVPDTPQNEDDSPTALSSTAVFDNRPGILIEGSNIPVNPNKRRRSSPVLWSFGGPTKRTNSKRSPRLDEVSPHSERMRSIVQESDVLLRSGEEEGQADESRLSPAAQRPSARRASTRGNESDSYSSTPGLRYCKPRELIPAVVHESFRVGQRPDSAIAEPTALGEKIEVRTRSSSGTASHINIEWSVHPDVPETLVVDERDLGKLVSCVFLNAIKFTDVGNVTVTVQPTRSSRYVQINIVDTGTGIPKDFLPELFKPFTQEDDSMTRSREGLGLGLLVAKGLARRIGGDLALVRSDTTGPHKGSEFEIRVPIDSTEGSSRHSTPSNRTPTPSAALTYPPTSRPQPFQSKTSNPGKRMSPLQKASPARQNSTPRITDAPRASSPRRMSSAAARDTNRALSNKDTFDRKLAEKHPLTFLVAEDNKINRKLLVNMLSKLGYKDVYEAFDGKEAVRVMTELYDDNRGTPGTKRKLQPVDVILMDLWMPEMDGYEATERILQMYKRETDGPALPTPTVLAVSADVTDEAISKATTTGMEGFMTKPYKLADLQRLIVEFCVRSEKA